MKQWRQGISSIQRGYSKNHPRAVHQFPLATHPIPDNKFKAWAASIKKIIKEESSMAKEIEQNISQLVHLELAIPFIHHFMSRLRDLHMLAKRR
jgi:hypothetical protein